MKWNNQIKILELSFFAFTQALNFADVDNLQNKKMSKLPISHVKTTPQCMTEETSMAKEIIRK